ncbi:triose-phosphate isomerase [Vibrio sp. SS-MA-C1-2]|nr:triose-phosphate isomerase [Vibrio sp. SS-MA-C1-2]
MNKVGETADIWAEHLVQSLNDIDNKIQPFVIPPFPYIKQVSDILVPHSIKVGGQNMCWEESGAFTGEVSPLMLRDCGASIVEIGHSERRALFNETDEKVNKKVLSALKNNLTPLVCVGDTLQEKEWQVSQEAVIKQVIIALYDVPTQDITKVIFAYEPVWAIGDKGVPATEEEAEFIHHSIRSKLRNKFGSNISEKIKILYGGSVNLQNARKLTQQKNIDGLFIGRSAWSANDFVEIIKTI